MILACLILIATLCFVAAAGTYPLEDSAVVGESTGAFHLQRIGDRWWTIAPDGSGDFTRAVSLFDTTNATNYYGNFRHYDMVALVPDGTPLNRESLRHGRVLRGPVVVTQQAEDSNPSDVVLSSMKDPVTVQRLGDAIVFGSSAFPPEFTFFQLSRLGVGGAIRWYYLAAGGVWKPISGSGRPDRAIVLDASGSYSMDVGGGYYGVAADGFQNSDYPTSDRVTWWPTEIATGVTPWPSDFRPQVLAALGTVRRYYIKGVVTRAYSIPPVVSQLYERENVDELAQAKYGGRWPTPFVRWAGNTIAKLESWGFNAAGQYSYRYDQVHALSGDDGVSVPHPFPSLKVVQVSDLAMRSTETVTASPIKNIYAGVAGQSVCVGQYEGRSPDVFDPNYQSAIDGVVRNMLVGQADPSYYYGLVPEEADDLFAINNNQHQHLGFEVLAENPYQVTDPVYSVTYADPKFYAKNALQKFLASEYGCSNSPEPSATDYCGSVAAEKALLALNEAWGTSYTTWDTSSGSVVNGTNEYGSGTGFLDEDGRHIFYNSSGCHEGEQLAYDSSGFTNPAHPALRSDLDAFAGYYATTYAQAMSMALAQVESRPPVFLPLYSAPVFAYKATARFFDGFWIHPGINSEGWSCVSYDPTCTADDLNRIYRAAGKPLIVADYFIATADSQIGISGTVTATSYNEATSASQVAVSGMNWWLAQPNNLNITNSTCAAYYLNIRPSAVRWKMGASFLTMPGDWSSCLTNGSSVAQVITAQSIGDTIAVDFPSQSARALAMIARWEAEVNYQGPDGIRPVVGLEHWSLYDESPQVYASPPGEYGLFTVNDNPYDGVSDKTAPATDPAGYLSGGEEENYGDLLAGSGGIGPWLTSIYGILQ